MTTWLDWIYTRPPLHPPTNPSIQCQWFLQPIISDFPWSSWGSQLQLCSNHQQQPLQPLVSLPLSSPGHLPPYSSRWTRPAGPCTLGTLPAPVNACPSCLTWLLCLYQSTSFGFQSDPTLPLIFHLLRQFLCFTTQSRLASNLIQLFSHFFFYYFVNFLTDPNGNDFLTI